MPHSNPTTQPAPAAPSNVIRAADLFTARRKEVAAEKIAVRAAEYGPLAEFAAQGLARHFHPSVKALPFVQVADGADPAFAHPKQVDYWAVPDQPGHEWERGREYARMTIAAIVDDGAEHYALRFILDAMIETEAKRRAKGGKGSRTTSCVAHGFIEEIAMSLTSAIRGVAS